MARSLRGLSKPQSWLRVRELRIFYDVTETTVEVLAIVANRRLTLARTVRKAGVKQVPLSEVEDDLSRYLREAETQEIVITRHGKPESGAPILPSASSYAPKPLRFVRAS